jgi:hypothetical protein
MYDFSLSFVTSFCSNEAATVKRRRIQCDTITHRKKRVSSTGYYYISHASHLIFVFVAKKNSSDVIRKKFHINSFVDSIKKESERARGNRSTYRK